MSVKNADPNFEFALSHHWWSWSHPTIHEALALAIMSSVSPKVSESIKSNRSKRVSPLSIEDLSSLKYLRRHSSHTGRVLTGGNLATVQFLLGISTALSIPFHKIMPDETSIIAMMTTELAGGSVTYNDAELYARYRCGPPNPDCPNIDKDIAQLVTRSHPLGPDCLSPGLRIMSVVERITPSLVSIDQDIENRRGV